MPPKVSFGSVVGMAVGSIHVFARSAGGPEQKGKQLPHSKGNIAIYKGQQQNKGRTRPLQTAPAFGDGYCLQSDTPWQEQAVEPERQARCSEGFLKHGKKVA